MGTLRFKKRKHGKTVQLVRYLYCPKRKRSITVTIGSLPIDADPDDFSSLISFANERTAVALRRGNGSLTENDFVLIKGWLLQHGDRHAAERRAARDERVAQALLDQIRAGDADAGDALRQVIELLPAAGELLLSLSAGCRARGQNPWDSGRKPYLEVQAAYKAFEQRAKDAGLTKERRKPVSV